MQTPSRPRTGQDQAPGRVSGTAALCQHHNAQASPRHPNLPVLGVPGPKSKGMGERDGGAGDLPHIPPSPVLQAVLCTAISVGKRADLALSMRRYGGLLQTGSSQRREGGFCKGGAGSPSCFIQAASFCDFLPRFEGPSERCRWLPARFAAARPAERDTSPAGERGAAPCQHLKTCSYPLFPPRPPSAGDARPASLGRRPPRIPVSC